MNPLKNSAHQINNSNSIPKVHCAKDRVSKSFIRKHQHIGGYL